MKYLYINISLQKKRHASNDGRARNTIMGSSVLLLRYSRVRDAYLTVYEIKEHRQVVDVYLGI